MGKAKPKQSRFIFCVTVALFIGTTVKIKKEGFTYGKEIYDSYFNFCISSTNNVFCDDKYFDIT